MGISRANRINSFGKVIRVLTLNLECDCVPLRLTRPVTQSTQKMNVETLKKLASRVDATVLENNDGNFALLGEIFGSDGLPEVRFVPDPSEFASLEKWGRRYRLAGDLSDFVS